MDTERPCMENKMFHVYTKKDRHCTRAVWRHSEEVSHPPWSDCAPDMQKLIHLRTTSFVSLLHSCFLLFDRTDVSWLAEQKKECFAILCPRLKSNSYIVFDALTINLGWQTLKIKCCTCIKNEFSLNSGIGMNCSETHIRWANYSCDSSKQIWSRPFFGLVKVWHKIGHCPSCQSQEDYGPHALQQLPGHCMNFHPHSDKDCFHFKTMCGHERYPFLKADKKQNSVTKWVEIKANNMFTFIWRWAHHS